MGFVPLFWKSSKTWLFLVPEPFAMRNIFAIENSPLTGNQEYEMNDLEGEAPSSDSILEPLVVISSQNECSTLLNVDDTDDQDDETSSKQSLSMRRKKMLLVFLAILITLVSFGLGIGLGVPKLGGKGMSSVFTDKI